MATSFWKIYNAFLGKVTDFDLPLMSDEELLAYCDTLLFSALPKIKSFDNDLTDRDDLARIFNADLSDTECEVLASQMVIEWVRGKINNTQLIHMFVGTKDENMHSQSGHMKTLLELEKAQRATISALMRDWKWQKWVKEGSG